MKLSEFDYTLPKELIAQYPLKRRDQSRLLVLNRKAGSIEHKIFSDIADYFKKDDLLVLNDTKVLPCRIKGNRLTGGKVELLLLNRKSGLTFNSLIKPARLRVGERINLNSDKISAIVSARNEVKFLAPNLDSIYALGSMPLPPYIKREPVKLDSQQYQTIYAKNEGAIASPTAGLHFTNGLISQLKSKGLKIASLTLHTGYATFKPVKSEDIREHKMGEEKFIIPAKTLRSIHNAKKNNNRIIAVGTTTTRSIESIVRSQKSEVRSQKGCTDLFIYPGYKFKFVDCLITNFHLPRTTLFMLVCAFCAAGASSAAGGSAYGRASGRAGTKLIKEAYREAIAKKYRFYSYGDAMLII